MAITSNSGGKTINLGDEQTGLGAAIALAGDGSYKITTGTGNHTVLVSGSNNQITTADQPGDKNFITGGSGIIKVGNGDNSISLGDGDNTVFLGTGTDEVKLGKSIELNKVFGGGSGTARMIGGPGNDDLVGGLGGHSVETGGGGVDTFHVANGDEVTDFISGDTIDVITKGDIEDAFIFSGTDSTTVQVYNGAQPAFSAPDQAKLDGVYDPKQFSGTRPDTVNNLLELTYTGPNPTLNAYGVSTPFYDAIAAVDHAVDRLTAFGQGAVDFGKDWAQQTASRELFIALAVPLGVAVAPAIASSGLALWFTISSLRFAYDVIWTYEQRSSGQIDDAGLHADIAGALTDFIPFVGPLNPGPSIGIPLGKAFADATTDQTVDNMVNVINQFPTPGTVTQIPIKVIEVLSSGGNLSAAAGSSTKIVLLNDSAQGVNVPAG